MTFDVYYFNMDLVRFPGLTERSVLLKIKRNGQGNISSGRKNMGMV